MKLLENLKIGKVVEFGIANISKYDLLDDEFFDDSCIKEFFFPKTDVFTRQFELNCCHYDPIVLIEVETIYSQN